MTIETTGAAGGAVVPYSEDAFTDIGLEDVGVSDIAIPRLVIQHTDGVFKDSLSGATFPVIDVVLLGLVKQRVFWDKEVEDGDKPLCKSPDFVHGFPNLRETVPLAKRFPFEGSGFSPEAAVPVVLEPSKAFPEGFNSNELPVLPCASCAYANWSTNAGKAVQPPCSEQHTYPLMYSPDQGENWITALLTVQKSAIKNSRSYVSFFVQNHIPMFTVYTRISLDVLSRGSVKYSVPKFVRGAATERDDWPMYAGSLRSVRTFVRQSPRNADASDEEEAAAPSANVNTAPAAPAAPAATPVVPPAAPVAAPAPAPAVVTREPAATPAPVDSPAMAMPPAADDDDDDLPF